MTSSCSFQITRTAQDLVHTVDALSKHLVKLEKRQKALENKLTSLSKEASDEAISNLDRTNQLLNKCHVLLETSKKNIFSENASDALTS